MQIHMHWSKLWLIADLSILSLVLPSDVDEGARVILEQPSEEAGANYICRQVTKTRNELFAYNKGCWTLNDFLCNNSNSDGGDNLPFKWGSDCYLGRIVLPDGVCVEGIRLYGSWSTSPCTSVDIKFSFCGGGLHDFWEFTDRVCALRFFESTSTSYPDNLSVVLEQSTSTGSTCTSISLTEKELFSNNDGCWTANDFQCDNKQGMIGSNLPFKNSALCNVGRVQLPNGFCVQGIRLWGKWNSKTLCTDPFRTVVIEKCGGTADMSEGENVCALRFYRQVGDVFLEQPRRANGVRYRCVMVSKTRKELLDYNDGCWTLNDFHCEDSGGDVASNLPFKWGNDCFVGRITLPDDLCVEGIRLYGDWPTTACTSNVDAKFSFCGDGLHDFWEFTDRVCALRFFTNHDPDPKTKLTVQQAFSNEASCTSVDLTEKQVLSNVNACWTANDFQCNAVEGMIGSNLPFKTGRSCNIGRVHLPTGLCAEAIKLWGAWNVKTVCTDRNRQVLARRCGGTLDTYFDHEHLACALRFYRSGEQSPVGYWNPLTCIMGGMIKDYEYSVSTDYRTEISKMIKVEFESKVEGNLKFLGLDARQATSVEIGHVFAKSSNQKEKIITSCDPLEGRQMCLYQFKIDASIDGSILAWNSKFIACSATPPLCPPFEVFTHGGCESSEEVRGLSELHVSSGTGNAKERNTAGIRPTLLAAASLALIIGLFVAMREHASASSLAASMLQVRQPLIQTE